MRRAILILGVLLGGCGGSDALGGGDDGEPVELLPAAERDGGDVCTEGSPVDAADVYAVLMDCADAGDLPIVADSYGTLCWSMGSGSDLSDACRAAHEEMPIWQGSCEDIQNEEEGPDPSACRQVSADVWCQVGKAIICENENASGCETPEAINERADATVEAICG